MSCVLQGVEAAGTWPQAAPPTGHCDPRLPQGPIAALPLVQSHPSPWAQLCEIGQLGQRPAVGDLLVSAGEWLKRTPAGGRTWWPAPHCCYLLGSWGLELATLVCDDLTGSGWPWGRGSWLMLLELLQLLLSSSWKHIPYRGAAWEVLRDKAIGLSTPVQGESHCSPKKWPLVRVIVRAHPVGVAAGREGKAPEWGDELCAHLRSNHPICVFWG